VGISFRDDHVYIHLIESAPFNKGKNKAYLGVPGNLVALPVRFHFNAEEADIYRSIQKLS
jgi:hypothetical protein